MMLRLRCYCTRHGSRHYAHCIDLNLAVLRETVAECRLALGELIDDYLEHVIELGSPRHLRHRPSPCNRRLEYWKTRLFRPDMAWEEVYDMGAKAPGGGDVTRQ